MEPTINLEAHIKFSGVFFIDLYICTDKKQLYIKHWLLVETNRCAANS